MLSFEIADALEQCKMSYGITIQDLPDEMLEHIFLQLGLEDRKSVWLVCKRWSELTPFDLSSVKLEIDLDYFRLEKKDFQDYHRVLLASSRRYKYVEVSIYHIFEMHDLLLEILTSFSGSVETLILNCIPVFNKPTIKLMLLAKIAALFPKMKHLQIDECEFESNRIDFEFSPMNNLEELYLKNDLVSLIPNMQDITPNITHLHLLIKSEESLDFLRHVSSRLVELELWFKQEEDFLAVCSMQFPLLKKVSFSDLYFYSENSELTSFVLLQFPNETIDRFFQSRACELKALTLRKSSDHVGNLCRSQSCEMIQSLCLGNSRIILDAHDFREICKLNHLKRLKIEGARVSVPSEHNFPPLKSLHMLSLDNVIITDHLEFGRFRQYAFPNLDIVEMIDLYYNDQDLFVLYGNICSDMPVMKRLTIEHSTGNIDKLELKPFLELCATPGSRELRIICLDVLDNHPLGELLPIPVETLIMWVSSISLETLQKLIKSMGKLKRLELAFDRDSENTLQPEEIQSLRVAFPQCEVMLKKRVQIMEPF